MIDNYIQFFCDFEDEFDQLKSSIANPIIQAQQLVRFLEKKLRHLNKWLRRYKFETLEQEIYFFKFLKPSIVSKIIYYSCIIKTESNLPINKKERVKYYQKKIKRIHNFTVENNQFYAYYRSNSSHYDNEYFIRKELSNIHQSDLSLLNSDPKTSTSHDYLMAQMIACDLQTEWLESLIKGNKKRPPVDNASVFKWYASQYDLVEISQAIFHSGVVKGRNISQHDFTVRLGKFLGMEITAKQAADAFKNIRARKTDQTKFVDFLNQTLFSVITGESLN
ncbi:MAG: RteC domain-containing protein [Flavobacterium sp.]